MSVHIDVAHGDSRRKTFDRDGSGLPGVSSDPVDEIGVILFFVSSGYRTVSRLCEFGKDLGEFEWA